MTGGFPAQRDSNAEMFLFDDIIIFSSLGLYSDGMSHVA